MTDETRAKPTECRCPYPNAVARNMNGHDPSCPVYQRWRERLGKRQGDPRRRHMPDEDNRRQAPGSREAKPL